MTRDDWRQSVPDAETFDQLFDRARRKSEVPAAPRFGVGVGAVKVPPRPTPRSAPRLPARVVINPERAGALAEKAPDEPPAAPIPIRFGTPPPTLSAVTPLPLPVSALPPDMESFADVLDDEPPRSRTSQVARPASPPLPAPSPAAPPVAPRFLAPPLAAASPVAASPVAATPVAAPPPAVRFGPPPPAPEPAPRRVDTLPPPRRQLVTLPFLQKRSLTTGGSIAVSALTASLVAGIALGVHAWRLSSIAPAPAAGPLAPASAAIAPPPAAPSAVATTPETAPKAAAPAPAEPSSLAELPPGYGRLTVQSPQDADVYLTGKRAGPANGPLDVRCGTWFVRLARPGQDPPEWVGAGQTVRVACQAATAVELGSGQSSLVLKRPPRP